jgi:hypothetical protein
MYSLGEDVLVVNQDDGWEKKNIARHKGDKSAFLFIDERCLRLSELCQCNGASRKKNIILCHTIHVKQFKLLRYFVTLNLSYLPPAVTVPTLF